VQSGKAQVYGEGSIPMCYLYAVFTVTGLTLIPTVAVAILYLLDCWRSQMEIALRVAWVWWVIAPPIWFSIEYFLLFKGKGADHVFESFKYGQDVSAKSWIAFVVILTAILEKKLWP